MKNGHYDDYYDEYEEYDGQDYYDEYDDYDPCYEEHYGQYAGTYAQDVEGLSDEFINDVLDGEPDAYWNID